MAEKIGLEAVLDLGNFSRGLAEYTSGISKMTSQTATAASQLSGQFVGLGQGVLRFGAIAGGVALAGVAALGTGFAVLGATALDEYAKYERLSLSLTSLVAREISQGKEVEQQRQVITQLTADESAEINNLNTKIQEESLERQTLLGRIQEQKQRVIDLTTAYGEQGLNVQTAKAKLAEMEFELTKSDAATATMTTRVNELNSKNGQLITTIDKVRVGQMSMGDAMAQASPKAQDLLKWIQLLAVQSPFNQEGIADAFRTAMAYGFTTEEAKRLTQAEVDFASATGKSVEATNLIALALGQMQAKGKVSGQEIIQLTNAGIGVNAILESMGYTLDDVSKGLVSSDAFIEAVITDMEVFEGAAKSQSATFSGLISTLGDLKAVGLREFFAGTFIAIQPYLADFVDWLTKISIETGGLRAIGDVLGTNVAGALRTIGGLIAGLQTTGGVGLLGALGITPVAVTLFNQIKTALGEVSVTISSVLAPALSGMGGPIDTLNAGIIIVSQNFESFRGALIGIGAVLATGVFAALVAGLLSLLTPINLIIAGAALLGAAWAGNWGNIQGITQQALATITGLFNTYWPQISAVALTAFEVLKSVFNGLVTALQPAIANIQTAFNNLTQALANIGISWSDVGNALLTSIGIVAAGIGAVLLAVISVATGFVSGLAAAIATGTEIFAQMTALWQQNLGNLETIITGVIMIIQGIFSPGGTWGNVFTGASMVLQGFVQGVTTGMAIVLTAITAPLQTALSFMEGFVIAVVGFWQGLFNTLVGNSIIPDMVTAIIFWFNALTAPIMAVFDSLSQGIATVLSGVFGALTGGGEGGAMFDPAVMLQSFTAIKQQVDAIALSFTNLSTITLPALSSALSVLAPAWIAQFTSIQTGVSTLDLTLQNLGLVTLPALILAAATLATGWATQTTTMQQSTMALDTSIQSIASVSMPALGTAATAAGQAMVSGLSRVPAAIQTILRAVTSLSTLVSQLKQIATQAADGVVTAFTEIDWSEIGRNIGEGIAEGLESQQGTIVDLAREVAKAALDAAKEELGISSPSQAFYDIGVDTIAGLIIGFKEGRPILMKTITETMREAMLTTKDLVGMMSVEVWADFMGGASNFASFFTGELSNQSSELETQIQNNQQIVDDSLAKLAEATGRESLTYDDMFFDMFVGQQLSPQLTTEETKQLEDLNLKLKEEELERNTLIATIRQQQEKVSGLTSEYGDQSSNVQLAKAKLAEMELELAKSNTATSDMTSQLNALNAKLNQVYDPFDPLNQTISDAVTAQEALNQQTYEYKKLQEQITKQQEEQQQLKFLQQQIDLLDFIKEYKLRPEEVLQGITLGTGASVSDLANATSSVIQAVIARLSGELSTAQFAGGTIGSAVPAGYPNDTYRVGLTSGEEFMVAPRGTSLDSMVMTRLGDMLQSNVSRGAVGGRSVQVIFNNTQVNNGMDLANLGSFVRQEVARAI
jgi:tape measure domain-containing protein